MHPHFAYLILHAADLAIAQGAELSFPLQAGGRPPMRATAIEYDALAEVAKIRFAGPIPVGPATLSLAFEGAVNDQMRGCYRSAYTTQKGEARHMVVTQFEAADARRCFPCFDEPAFKATFELSLVVPAGRVALSNMPAVATLVEGPLKTVRFAPSVKMSTYLVAFVVGELEAIEGKTKDGG